MSKLGNIPYIFDDFFLNLIHKDHFAPIWIEMYHLDIAINRLQRHKEKLSSFARLPNFDCLVEKNRKKNLAQTFSEILVIHKSY